MDRKKEVRRYLRRTVEVSLMVRNFFIWLGITVLCGAIMYLNLRHIWFVAIFVLIAIAPNLIFFLIRYLRIMAKAESYCFYRTKLTSPHHSLRIKHRFYFTVRLEEDGEVPLTVDTHSVFHTYSILWPRMEDCLNQTVTVAYNPETNMVVVAG